MSVLQMLLLLCAGSSIAEDLFSPNVNIVAELEKVKKMEEKIQKLEETLTKVLSDNEASKVAFSAGLLDSGSGNTGPSDSAQNLVYKKVFSNVGTAYDSNTGVFTAPVKGVYFFRFYAHCLKSSMGVSLLKNGERQCSVFSWSPNSANGSNGVILTLEAGDKINTQLWENTWVHDSGSSFTSFSGFLIFPL